MALSSNSVSKESTFNPLRVEYVQRRPNSRLLERNFGCKVMKLDTRWRGTTSPIPSWSLTKPRICLALKTRTHSAVHSAHGRAFRQAIGVKLTVALPRIKDRSRLEDMVLVIGELWQFRAARKFCGAARKSRRIAMLVILREIAVLFWSREILTWLCWQSPTVAQDRRLIIASRGC
jgi:hypothetical protein